MCHVWSMPTDGADFGTARICFGKAYVMARNGADDADLSACVMLGVERLIRFQSGAPAFRVVVQTLVVASRTSEGGAQLLRDLERVSREFADSPLTRDLVAAAETIGLTAISKRASFSQYEAAESLLVHVGQTRCDAMLTYIVRHRTGNLAEGRSVVESIKSHHGRAPSTHDLATRMLCYSEKGLPAKAAKIAPVSHTAEGLNNDEL